jgi:phenylacetate-CoA ligase
MKLFDLTLKASGFPLDSAKSEFARILSIPAADYAEHIENAKQSIVEYHLEYNPFYRQLVEVAAGSTNWSNLPVMTKADLQMPLDKRLSQGYSKSDIYINKTSGSSGHPFVFAKDKYSHAITWASYIYRFGWYGVDFNSSLQARFYGIPLDFWGYRKERVKDYLSHRYRFPIFDLSDKVLDGFLAVFQRKKFDYINGYTSSIVLFARYLSERNLVLKNICPSLKVCIVTSEMLFDDDRELLRRQFGVPVVNEYGASELDLIAFENTAGEWQVNAETLYVEIVGRNDEVLPHGSEGRIVITSLHNKAHPFIRYDIGDIGILDERSTPKKPILKKLTGRTNDVAILPGGKKSPGLTFYYITKSIIEDDGNVREFVIRQTAIDSFEIDYVSRHILTEAQISKINDAAAEYLEPGLKFVFNRKDVLERSNRGKLKQFSGLQL